MLRLKVERNAVILGHNYMEPALFHSVPDFQGDSLELSRARRRPTSPVIVFCGVRFMAETAKILNPTKTVLLPTEKGGCSLAESITAADVRALRAAYPGVPIVTYINTYADVKAECDICCTSSNAVAVVESLKSDTVIFLPDEYLAQERRARDRLPRDRAERCCRSPAPRKPGTRRRAGHDRLEGPLRGARTLHDRGRRLGAQAVSRRDDPRAPGVQPRGGREGRLLRQHDRDDQGRREIEARSASCC